MACQESNKETSRGLQLYHDLSVDSFTYCRKQNRKFRTPQGEVLWSRGRRCKARESKLFKILKQIVPPDRMIKAFEDGRISSI